MIIYRGPSGHHISQQQWRTISASTIQHSRPPLHILEEHHSTTNLSPRVFANTERMDLALESYGLQQHLRTLRMAVLDEWSQYPTSHDVHRNALAHGNILADMRTIAFMEEWNTTGSRGGSQSSLSTMARTIKYVLTEIYNFLTANSWISST